MKNFVLKINLLYFLITTYNIVFLRKAIVLFLYIVFLLFLLTEITQSLNNSFLVI